MVEQLILSPTNKKDKELIEQLNKVYIMKEKFKKIKEDHDTLKDEVYQIAEEYMKEAKVNSLSFVENNNQQIVTIKKIQSVGINWAIEKLCKKLPKALLDKVLIKKYSITNWGKVTEVMKKYGVPASEIIPYISVEKQVSQEAVNHYYELGEIKTAHLKDCYTTEITSSYLQMSKSDIVK